MSSIKNIVKLDKDRELIFAMPAIATLDEVCKINLLAPVSYQDMSPSQVVSLVWAGQLHTKGALTRSQVAAHISPQPSRYFAVAAIVAKAIREALSDKTDKDA